MDDYLNAVMRLHQSIRARHDLETEVLAVFNALMPALRDCGDIMRLGRDYDDHDVYSRLTRLTRRFRESRAMLSDDDDIRVMYDIESSCGGVVEKTDRYNEAIQLYDYVISKYTQIILDMHKVHADAIIAQTHTASIASLKHRRGGAS